MSTPPPPAASADTGDKENTDPKTPAPKNAKARAKKDKKAPSEDTRKRAARAVWSVEDDRTMIDTFLDQKAEGFATDNGGWRDPALKAVVRALKDSELTSGGAEKNVRTVRDHWNKVCN